MERDMFFGIGALIAGVLCIIKVIIDRRGEHLSGVISDFVLQNGVKFPVVTFTYNGQELQMRAANADNKKVTKGQNVEIIYRPGKGKYVNIIGSVRDIVVAVGLTICGIGIIIICLLK